jgi:hypothetical protein
MYIDFGDQFETVHNLIYEFPEVFRNICEILGFTYSEEATNYNDQEIKDIYLTLKQEYRPIWKEL